MPGSTKKRKWQPPFDVTPCSCLQTNSSAGFDAGFDAAATATSTFALCLRPLARAAMPFPAGLCGSQHRCSCSHLLSLWGATQVAAGWVVAGMQDKTACHHPSSLISVAMFTWLNTRPTPFHVSMGVHDKKAGRVISYQCEQLLLSHRGHTTPRV